MPKACPFEIWKEVNQNSQEVEKIMRTISKFLDHGVLPTHMKSIDYYFHEDLREQLLRYIYTHSSNKFTVVLDS